MNRKVSVLLKALISSCHYEYYELCVFVLFIEQIQTPNFLESKIM